MKMYDIITAKKQGKALTSEQIKFFVQGVTDGSIPDYQVSALLMAIYFKGMEREETASLTFEMAHSGKMLDFSQVQGARADKHSTGGVGDKTTLIVAPIVASCGVKVVKLSGRGLGHTGGTTDKLESIPRLSCELDYLQMLKLANFPGICIASASQDIAPADKILYAMRDTTATVDSVPLITASILSKKIASGADNIVFDVKCGSGAFCKTIESATLLAKELAAVGSLAGIRVRSLATNMDEPLGYTVGNGLEVAEALDILSNKGCTKLRKLCIVLSANMLNLAEVDSLERCTLLAEDALTSGKAKELFLQMIIAQGGSAEKIGYQESYALDCIEVKARKTGFIRSIDAEKIGLASMYAGAGRQNKEDIIDYHSGIILAKKTGDAVEQGQTIATIYAKHKHNLEHCASLCLQAYTIGQKPHPQKLILDIV